MDWLASAFGWKREKGDAFDIAKKVIEDAEKRRSPQAIPAGLNVSRVTGIDDRYSITHTTKEPNGYYSVSYVMDIGDVPGGVFEVYGARMGHEVYHLEEGKVTFMGRMEDLLDESPTEHLMSVYLNEGLEAFISNVHNNEGFNYKWGGNDPIELLRSGEITPEDFLVKGVYIVMPYETLAPPAFSGLKGKIIELSGGYRSFIGHRLIE